MPPWSSKLSPQAGRPGWRSGSGLRSQGQLAGDGQAVIDRFLTGTARHALRRSKEMQDTASYLSDLGVPAEMTHASATALTRMAQDTAPGGLALTRGSGRIMDSDHLKSITRQQP